MPPVVHTEAEESDFLSSLFNELDSAPIPAPSSSPTRRRAAAPQPRTPLCASRFNGSPHGVQAKHAPQADSPKFRHTVYAAQDVDFDALMDGVDDWDWDEMKRDPTTRCIVKGVEERFTAGRFEKVLTVVAVPTKDTRHIVLRDDWSHGDVRTGDTANVIGEWTMPSASSSSHAPMPSITVCSKHNLFIHHPDVLLTATSLSNASQCLRKPLLSNMVRSSSDVTPSLIWGNMLHEVMQTCLSVARWDDKFMDKKIAEVAQAGLGELLRIDMGVEQAIIEVKTRAKGLKVFAEKYIAQSPRPEAYLVNTRAGRGESSLLAISQLYDIEEDIWSPTYGLKGKIDASVEAVVHDLDDSSTPFTRTAPQLKKHSSPMPFEIKTGRAMAGMEHRAQTMLYTLLMGERYGAEVPSGLLYYTQSEEVVRVPAARNEIRALMVMRNEMASYMMHRLRATASFSGKAEDEDPVQTNLPASEEPFLPPTIDDNRTCGKCYTLDTCMLYRKAIEGVEDDNSDIADIYALKTGHLSPQQAAFFKKWEALISLEEKDLVRFRKELWTMSASEREERGRCFGGMVLDVSYRPSVSVKPTIQKEGKIHRLTYRFTKTGAGGASLLNGHMVIGDAVTVSVEPELLALTRGFIVELAPDSVVIGADHELDEDLIADRLRTIRGSFMGQVVFRIDKDELFGGMGRIRDNLAQLFYASGDARRLELVVDLAKPLFTEDSIPETTEATAHLNHNQKRAVYKVMRAQDYALILGMPGTGKTTVIAAIIKELVKAGKSVLLSSYTHSAVDTILSKLDDADFGILRLGNPDKIHPGVQKFTMAARPPAKNIEQLQQQVMTPPVVATTCLSIDHPLFSRRRFDYCIVDEASQITLPTCLGPLRFAEKFVLVGDHFQLPPLVKNKAARKGGLEISLFRRLSDAHPSAVVDLTHQYRMNSDIMLLSNKLIYSDRLRCGSDAVASQSLSLPNPKFLRLLHAKSTCHDACCWMNTLMTESCKAVFVDTDQVPARDSRVGDLVENKVEAQLVHQVTECLLGCGVRQDQIGVISLYRQQLKLLSYLLQDRKELEMLTADRSQGRDKDCIIISMVRSNDDGMIGELVKDWRRMNVSFTRARSKLIIIGSRKTLQGTPLLKEFFDLMDGRGWILALPPDAHLMHDFAGGTPRKRAAGEMTADDLTSGSPLVKENGEGPGSAKRSKNVAASEESILKGRPLLRDLVNAHK
ncbi:DNA replication ATP-dependent helicase/nuclease DNA2 [Trametes pubescens]|uniref:DNA replication ATP-dependent helicase/nuclease DNA2 n=1 Tax=Trametes pubescens TaxID=154538 RepID=A0A1M2W6Z7_TRAPU|nr:DNA replication ATP-dependent helicase/nuclease DNA2 [Trametes pubescens]